MIRDLRLFGVLLNAVDVMLQLSLNLKFKTSHMGCLSKTVCFRGTIIIP